MENKTAYSFFGIALVLLFVVGIVSSTTSSEFSISNLNAPENVSEDEGSFQFTFDINYTGSLENATFSFDGSGATFGTVSITSDKVFNGTLGETKTITGTVSDFSGHAGEIMAVTIVASVDGTNETDDQTTFDVRIEEVPEFDFCNFDEDTKFGFENGSDLRIKRVKDKRVDNQEEWKWRPFDEVNIEVTVENNGDEDEDYMVEIVFMDSDRNIIDIAEDSDDLEEDISIDSGDDEKVLFKFEIDGDVDDDEYYMYVKFYQDGDEELQCVSQGPEDNDDVEKVDIKKNKNDVIVKEIVGSDSAKAGSTIVLEARVANVGRNDEDKVKIIAFSNELGIKIEKEIEDLEEGESKTVTFNIELPRIIEEKEYKISFGTEFEYDEDDEIYREVSDSEDDVDFYLTVLGGVANIAPRINAELRSDAVVGEELVLSVLITNNGEEDEFIISAVGADSWANVLSVNPQRVTLGEAETQEVLVTLNPFVGGYQTFKVVAGYGGETYEQPITISIDEVVEPAEVTGGFLSGSMFTENTSAYLIIGITALLILVLLVLIAKVSRRKGGATF